MKTTLQNVKFPESPFVFADLKEMNPEINVSTLRVKLQESINLSATKLTGETVKPVNRKGASQKVYIHT